MIRKWLCVLLSVLLALPAVCGLAAGSSGESRTLEYVYTFTPGEILEGEGTEIIRELMDALSIHFTRQHTENEDMVRLQLISEGEQAFAITARNSTNEEFSIVCSLLGDNMLLLRRDQLASFLHTLVQALGDKGIFKDDNLTRMNVLADRMANLLNDYLNKAPEQAPDTGIDLTPYLSAVEERASETVKRDIPPEEQDESGAVCVTTYLLNEEQRKHMFDRLMDKLVAVPLMGAKFKDGSLHIGNQVITEEFLRSIFADTPGESSMDVYQDESGQLVRLLIHIPDISSLVTDPQFAKVRGLELNIARTYGAGDDLTSVTVFRLIGLEGNLLTMRLDRRACDPIPPMKAKKMHQVGEMNGDELMKLIHAMGLTIVGNTLDMVITLPRCVYDMLIKRFF